MTLPLTTKQQHETLKQRVTTLEQAPAPIQEVASDATLSGTGAPGSPLSVQDSPALSGQSLAQVRAGIDAATVGGATPAQLRDRATHTGTQALTTVTGHDKAVHDSLGIDAATVGGRSESNLRSRAQHTGTQALSTITGHDKAAHDALGVNAATVGGATAAQLRDRATHTGTQPQSSVTGLVQDLQGIIDALSQLQADGNVPIASSALAAVLARALSGALVPDLADRIGEAELILSGDAAVSGDLVQPGSGSVIYRWTAMSGLTHVAAGTLVTAGPITAILRQQNSAQNTNTPLVALQGGAPDVRTYEGERPGTPGTALELVITGGGACSLPVVQWSSRLVPLITHPEGGGSGLESVASDSTLAGDGTSGSPLGIANNSVTSPKIADGAVTSPKIANNSVTNGQLATVVPGTLKGRVAAGSGPPTDLTAAQARELLALDQVANHPPASQAEAEAGTASNRSMTPQRAAQQTTARIATTAQAEGGSDNTRLMTPLRVLEQLLALVASEADAVEGVTEDALMSPLRTRQAIAARTPYVLNVEGESGDVARLRWPRATPVTFVEGGGASASYAVSTNNGDTYSAATLPITLQQGHVLRVTLVGLAGASLVHSLTTA